MVLIPGVNTNTHQHNQRSAEQDPREQTQVKLSQETSLVTPTPTVVTPTPTPSIPQPEMRVASSPYVVEEQPQPNPQPPKVEPNTTEVWFAFYYCRKTVEVPGDDGGGYCGNTKSGTPVRPGVAACPPEWLGRAFTIVGDNLDQIYTCEDTGGAVTGNKVDVWVAENGDGYKFPFRGNGVIIWRD